MEENDLHNEDNEENACGLSEPPRETQGNQITDEDLIEEPDLVHVDYVNYAKKSTVVDMKKLRKIMWDEIAKSFKTNINENSMQTDIKSTSLKVVFKDIQKTMSNNMKKNISFPIVFAALLQLANDHNLSLQKTDNLGDVIIIKK